MKKTFMKIKNQKGYAILFTVVVVSAISVITAGLSNTAYKQLILSSLAKDSQTAFYQADTAGDCALYADRKFGGLTPGPWDCGGNILVITSDTPVGNIATHTIYPVIEDSTDPCFRIDITKTTIPAPIVTLPEIQEDDVIQTRISAKGYNICDVDNLRTVEREVLINFSE
jgi:hypothetical protein